MANTQIPSAKNTRAQAVDESDPEHLSPVAQNYLLSLYVLGEEGVRATAGRLASFIRHLPAGEGLGTSMPSILAMLRRMSREGLVETVPGKEFRMTKRGTILAEEMVRRHRLAERMVVDLLGLELHKAHIEAHRLEHAMSSELAEKISQRLGNPTTCPFGRPIPGSGYVPPRGRSLTLDNTQATHTYIVDRVPEEDHVLLHFLVEHSVLPGEELAVEETGHYRGVLVFRTRAGVVTVSYDTASRIWVRQPD